MHVQKYLKTSQQNVRYICIAEEVAEARRVIVVVRWSYKAGRRADMGHWVQWGHHRRWVSNGEV